MVFSAIFLQPDQVPYEIVIFFKIIEYLCFFIKKTLLLFAIFCRYGILFELKCIEMTYKPKTGESKL